jgi:hypothetical protein
MRPGTTCMKQLDGNLLDQILMSLGLKSRNANINSCYTGDTVADSINIMGTGNIIDIPNVYPWAFRAAQHTHTDVSKWTISLRPVPPLDLKWFK